jgi:NAD(P)-dependent dehydrogenase (short-subunit alcohol dehydrogenase family)
MHTRLYEKVALITGAAGGFGRAIAAAFAQQGTRLALLDINGHGLEELAASLRASGTSVQATASDLSDERGVREGIAAVLEPYDQRVDVLVANVGLLIADACERLTTEQWQYALTINLLSHVWAVSAVLPLMKARGEGCIVFVGSDQGLQPDAGLAPYAVAKAATHSYMKILARELPPYGIWTNAIAPGMSRTPLVETLMDGYAREFGTDREEAERLELQRRGVPLARLGEPEEVARAVLFLANEPFSNGAIVNFSGGNVRSVAG